MNVAFIPVRGGSKSIPLKNIKPICGKPLVYWTVKAACECEAIDAVYVATDSERIRDTVESFCAGRDAEAEMFRKTRVIDRSAESASDTASTEFAMLEFARKYDFDNIVLVQATSPLLTADDLSRGFALFAEEGTDSVLSVVPQKRFNWAVDESGAAAPSNYDVYHRPRRQEFDGYYVENGAFYITSKADLLRSGNRVSGNIRAVPMSEDTFFEIDEPGDWIIIEALMKKNGLDAAPAPDTAASPDKIAIFDTTALNETSTPDEAVTFNTSMTAPSSRPTVGGAEGTGKPAIPEIKMFLTDCDGCLTDGGMYYSEHGDELKKFNTRDGMGFSLLRRRGILTGIITSETVDLNRRRAEKLRLDILEAGCRDKAAAIARLCEQYGISSANVAYIGDDINDLEAVRLAGFGCAPSDALPQVKAAADYVTAAKGGEGVIREVIDLILGES